MLFVVGLQDDRLRDVFQKDSETADKRKTSDLGPIGIDVLIIYRTILTIIEHEGHILKRLERAQKDRGSSAEHPTGIILTKGHS